MASIVWRAGTEVEVAGDASEGFANSWFRATLLSSVNTRTGMVPVELTHFYGADGVTPEQEHVALKRLRPPAPGPLEGADKPVGKVYALHSAVEVLADEVWWLGRVSKVSVDGKALDVQHKAGKHTNIWWTRGPCTCCWLVRARCCAHSESLSVELACRSFSRRRHDGQCAAA